MIYFASDLHLGLKFKDKNPKDHEKLFIKFLTSIEGDCDELFLLGDIFDFWFEWKHTVPKGYVRVLAKLAQMCDNGIKVHIFTGNHDLWVGSYFKDEIGMELHLGEMVVERDGKRLFLAHGDIFYKHKFVGRLLSTLFRSRRVRWIGQRIIHPDSLIKFGMNWSLSNRHKRGQLAHKFKGEDDFLVQFARGYISDNEGINAFIFGHEHTPVEYKLSDSCNFYILGEWVENPTYLKLDNGVFSMVHFN